MLCLPAASRNPAADVQDSGGAGSPGVLHQAAAGRPGVPAASAGHGGGEPPACSVNLLTCFFNPFPAKDCSAQQVLSPCGDCSKTQFNEVQKFILKRLLCMRLR